MFRNLFRAIFSVVGAIAGYGVFLLLKYILIQTGIVPKSGLTTLQEITLTSACVIIFTIIFYALAPLFTRKGKKVTRTIETDLKSFSNNEILGGTIGLILGLFLAFLITNVYDFIKIPYLP